MEKFKGTKGNWKVEFNYRKNTTVLEVNTYSEIGGKTNLHQYILDEDQCSVKECSCIAKEMANAKLIAAAPEMLEMLSRLMEQIDNEHVSNILEELVLEATELIKKATE